MLLITHTASAAPAADKEARALFQQAEMNFNLGKFSEALGNYQAAYQAKPLPGFLFNIAQCYRNMGNPERARFFYRRYLALEPRTPNRRLVEDLITEMTRLLERQGEPPAAVAGAQPAGAVAASPAVSAPASGAEVPATQPVTLAAAPPPVDPAPSSPQLVSVPAPEPARRPIYKRWWFWTGIGAVVAGGVVAAVMLTRSSDPQGTLPPICTMGANCD
jgi:hypothetical protein